MTDYFSELNPGGELTTNIEWFYQAMGRLDTLAHVRQVAAEAQRLAERHGVDVLAAYLAALAHDLAAVVPVAEMPSVAERMGIAVSDADRAIPMLLHGPIAAAALAAKLNILDEPVLNAVRYHSTLRAGAGTLEKIVFLADKIAYDPSSLHQGDYLPALRAAQALDEAALIYLDFVLRNAWRYDWVLHPRTVAAYRALVERSAR
jgi:predicted HD superfamily hydrolase involved in NAD metabolism